MRRDGQQVLTFSSKTYSNMIKVEKTPVGAHLSYIVLILLTIITWVAFAFFLLKANANSIIVNSVQTHLSGDIGENFQSEEKIEDIVPSTPQKSSKIKKIHIPKFMLELYERNKIRNGLNTNNSTPDIVRSVIPTHAGPTKTGEVFDEISDNHLLIFNLPTCNYEEELFVSAELKILTVIEINSNAVSGVERKLKISVYDDFTKKLSNLEEIHIYYLNNTWLSFNLTQPVTKILGKDTESKFLKIVITINDFLPYYEQSNDKNNLKISLMPVADNFEHDYPVLLLSYSSISSNLLQAKKSGDSARLLKRNKRNVEDDYEEETNNVWDDEILNRVQVKKMKKTKNSCRKKSLYINFAEIEYDSWIVQPPGYEAYQCQGKCFYPVADHLNPTKHAIVQALLHSVSPSKAVRSCCVPTLLDSISILYIDAKGVLTYRYAYKDMAVVECGCR